MKGSKNVAGLCGRLVDILSKSPSVNDSYFAGLARALQLASAKGLEHAAPIYQSLDWWGGSGSFADSAGSELPSEKRRAILQHAADLRDAFHHAGIEYPRADDWVGTFRSWLRESNLNKDLA